MEGGGAEGDLRTCSNQPPARPEEMHAARMARRPILGSWGVEEVEGGGWRTPSSWTVATPMVRRKSESHFVRLRERWKKMTEKRAAVRSLSWYVVW